MIGFVEADIQALNEEQLRRYRGAYCGLCRTLRERHGSISRLTLNYDLTFLVLLLSSMYEPEERSGKNRCLIHPVRARNWWLSKFTDYAADMSVALAYFNLMDNWADDKNVLSLGAAQLLRKEYEQVRTLRPGQCRALENCLSELHEIEQAGGPAPDAAANCFGRLMGALFCPEEEPVWGERLRAFGDALGRFVYMMDACVDYEKDRKHGNYNPFLAMQDENMTEEEKLTILKMLIGECTDEFERLPLVQDVDILRNVLYSGVWRQYALKLKKEKRDADDQRSL